MRNTTLDLPQIERQQLSNARHIIRIYAIVFGKHIVPDAVAIMDPLLVGFSADVFSIASDAYLIAA